MAPPPRNQLIALSPAGLSARTSEIPAEIWRRTYRGFISLVQIYETTETAEEKRWVEIMEAYGEEEIEAISPHSHVQMESGQAQPENRTWVRPHVGPPPAGGAIEVRCIVDRVAVKCRGLGCPIPGY